MDKIHIRIGSAVDNQLVIENSGIDAYHLELFSDSDGNVFITDLNTKNGTFVNGRLLKGFTQLSVGDKVVLGQHHLFRWESYIQKKTDASHSQKLSREIQIPVYAPVQNKKINKQLILIYALILMVLLSIGFLID
jgi:pSer/pThr/pTyr-binding forkhead associated (FHA) protein